MAFDNVHLSKEDQVAYGGQREIYACAAYPEFIFKRQKEREELDLKNDLKGWFINNFPSLNTFFVRKEYRAYVDSCVGTKLSIDDIPISKLYGFAHSNLGVVQIAEKVSLDGVSLGPTLADIMRNGQLTDDRLNLLTDFVQLLLEWNIPTNDVSAQNIVLGKRRGVEKWICVDGFGDIHVIPVRTYFPSCAARHAG